MRYETRLYIAMWDAWQKEFYDVVPEKDGLPALKVMFDTINAKKTGYLHALIDLHNWYAGIPDK